jgi:hypothetical protein
MKCCLSYHGLLILGLTRESLFEILARSETHFLDPKFSRDFCETCESKLVARLTSCESHRQKFRSENREKQVSLRNFVAKIASYESLRKKFCSETRKSRKRVSLRDSRESLLILTLESWENLGRILSLTLISRCELWLCLFVSLTNARLTNCEARKLDNISHFSLLASFVRLAKLALIFSREASLIFYKILARKIAKRDSLSTLLNSLLKLQRLE